MKGMNQSSEYASCLWLLLNKPEETPSCFVAQNFTFVRWAMAFAGSVTLCSCHGMATKQFTPKAIDSFNMFQ